MGARRLIFVRHAQAQLAQYGRNDRDRTITIQGMHELESIRRKTLGKLFDLSLVLCSNVKRTRQTLEGIRVLLPSAIECVFDDALYRGSEETIWAKIKSLPPHHHGVMVIGHNPSLLHILQTIQPGFKTMPTGGTVVCAGTLPKWEMASSVNLGITEIYLPEG